MCGWVQKAQRDNHHDERPRLRQKHFHSKKNPLSESQSPFMFLWKTLIKVMVIFALSWLDGADVRCLPPRCGREPGLQEPGSHHHPRRGKGPGVNRLSNRESVFCPYMTWNWPTTLEGDMDDICFMYASSCCLCSLLTIKTKCSLPGPQNRQLTASTYSRELPFCFIHSMFPHSPETN